MHDDGTQVLERTEDAVETLNCIVLRFVSEAPDEDVGVQRVFAISFRHRLSLSGRFQHRAWQPHPVQALHGTQPYRALARWWR